MSPKLSELITLLKGHRVFIQTHNFPDPDAIASAYGLQVLLERFKIPTTICHHGNIERTATANMVAEFGIKMTVASDLKDMTSEDYIITVDSQKGNANILDLIGDEVACIDHHPTFCPADYKYKDIRIVGSCATLIADYYMSYKMDMPRDVATALLYGLKMDTADFTRGVTELDIDVYRYLFPIADNQLIRNFILNLDVVTFAVVYSRKENGFKFSVRSELDELNAGTIAEEALQTVGSGGGHRSMAGGFAEESKILDISIDFNRVIQNLFLDVIDKLRPAAEEPQEIPVEESKETMNLE